MALETNNDICPICGLEVLEGEAIYGYDGSHWDCKYPDGVGPDGRLSKAMNDMDAALEKLKLTLKEYR